MYCCCSVVNVDSFPLRESTRCKTRYFCTWNEGGSDLRGQWTACCEFVWPWHLRYCWNARLGATRIRCAEGSSRLKASWRRRQAPERDWNKCILALETCEDWWATELRDVLGSRCNRTTIHAAAFVADCFHQMVAATLNGVSLTCGQVGLLSATRISGTRIDRRRRFSAGKRSPATEQTK